MNRLTIALLAGLAASTAAAQSQIVFTTSDTRNNPDAAAVDFIGLLDTAAPGSFSTLFQNFDPDSRLRRIQQNGSGDSFFVGDSPFPTNPGEGSLFRFDGLLAGAPVQTTLINDPAIRLDPNGIAQNAGQDYIIFNNHPSGTGTTPNGSDGIWVANSDGSNLTQILVEDGSAPRPRFQAGTELRRSLNQANTFYSVGLNGGDDGDFDQQQSSAITVVTVDPSDFSNSTIGNTIALNTTNTGLSEDLEFVQGFDIDNNGTFYFADNLNRAIYAAELNGAGDGFDSFVEIIDLDAAAAAAGVRRANVIDLEFDPFRNKLVFNQSILNSELMPDEFTGIGRISEINLDGSGFNVLLDGVYVSNLEVIPAPASVALLGLGGLAAARRRR